MDENQRFHLKWLGMVQPMEGLVVSLPVLRDAECFARQGTPVYKLFRDLCPPVDPEGTKKSEGPKKLTRKPEVAAWGTVRAIRDLGEFLAKLLDLTPDMFDRGKALPEALQLYVAEGQELLRPSLALRHAHAPPERARHGELSEAAKAGEPYVMLVSELPFGTELDKPDSRSGVWAYPPAAKFDRLLRACEVPIGLLVNGLEARLVYTPRGESTGSLTFNMGAMGISDGYVLLDALVMLLSAQRFFGVRRERQLPQLLADSRRRQAEVTNTLAKQVTAALQLLMEGFTQAAQRDGWMQLQEAVDRPGDHLYGGLMTVLLRLVFSLYCEDRGLLPVDNSVYAESLSLQKLFAELQADQGMYPDTMGQRFGAWGRLIALFRAIYCGVQHEELTLPPRRGDLFDPNAYPFLEGWQRGSAPIRQYAAQAKVILPSVSDGTVLSILKQLIILNGQRLSYRSLDVEQIGSVYEAVMGFHVQRLKSPAVCLRRCGTWVTAEEVLQVAPSQRATWLKNDVGMDKALAKKLAEDLEGCKRADVVLEVLRSFQQKGMQPAKAEELVLQPGKERRRTSSHYTPRSMTQPIVERGLEPILRGLGEKPTSAQILDLKVCDPAMGSGAFLVAVCRHLGDRLMEAWGREDENQHLLTSKQEDAVIAARRLVAQRCLYGVDRNPFAVRLAKLSLWAFTLAKDLPFTFMDHCLKWGDSLVGLTLEQIAGFDWVESPKPIPEFKELIEASLAEALPLRRKLRDLAFQNGRIPQQEKQQILDDAEDALQHVRVLGDLVLGCFFSDRKDRARRMNRDAMLESALDWVKQDGWEMPPQLLDAWNEARHTIVAFHWGVEFAEVFSGGEHGLLNAFVGNPPFMGKNGISSLGIKSYLDWLQTLHKGAHGNADYSAHFFRRAYDLLRDSGTLSLVATNTIGQGDTRDAGLGPLVGNGAKIYGAECNTPWQGKSAVTVSIVHLAKGLAAEKTGACILDGALVKSISSQLHSGMERLQPKHLAANANAAFIGEYVLGAGFLMTPKARALAVASDKRNKRVIQPYIGGEEVNRSPTQDFSRYVINFGDMPLHEARNWPSLLQKIEDEVKPKREKNNRDNYKKYWWKFAEQRPGLHAAIEGLGACLVTSMVTKHLCFSFQPTGRVFSKNLAVFALPHYAAFTSLQSRPYEYWTRNLSSTFGASTLNFAPTDCFRNFPFPHGDPRTPDAKLEAVGKAYYTARATYMKSTEQGLTKTYNAMKDPKNDEAPIKRLRQLHEAMDRAVLAAYGWSDLEVPPYCPTTPAEERAFAAFEAEVFERLFALNATRVAEEQGASVAPANAPKRLRRVDCPRATRRKKEAK